MKSTVRYIFAWNGADDAISGASSPNSRDALPLLARSLRGEDRAFAGAYAIQRFSFFGKKRHLDIYRLRRVTETKMYVPNINSWVTVCSVLLRGMSKVGGGGGGGSGGCMAFSIPSLAPSPLRSLSVPLSPSLLRRALVTVIVRSCWTSRVGNELEPLNRRAFRGNAVRPYPRLSGNVSPCIALRAHVCPFRACTRCCTYVRVNVYVYARARVVCAAYAIIRRRGGESSDFCACRRCSQSAPAPRRRSSHGTARG